MYVCVCKKVSVLVRVHACKYECVYQYVCMCVCKYERTCAYACVFKYVYVCVDACFQNHARPV